MACGAVKRKTPPGPLPRPATAGERGAQVRLLVAGLAGGTGLDRRTDMGLLRHAAAGTLLAGGRVPSAPGSFLRSLTWGGIWP